MRLRHDDQIWFVRRLRHIPPFPSPKSHFNMADLDMKPKLRAHGTAARLMKTGSKSSSSATKSASEARSSATAIPVEPFHFRKRRDNINWRSLAAVDITKIVRNV